MNGRRQVSLRVPVTPMVKKIMLANLAVYLMSVLLVTFAGFENAFSNWFRYLFLYHEHAFGSGHYWTLATYAWFHELGHPQGTTPLVALLVCAAVIYGIVRLYQSRIGREEFILFVIIAFAVIMLLGALGYGAPFHLAGNMVGLYFFGHLFEQRWGPRRFLWFWVLCTVGGGVLSTLMFYVWPSAAGLGAVVGASAGVMGLIAAYSVYFPDQEVLYGLVVPIKGKYFLVIAIIFDLVALAGQSNVAVFAHFGGIITAILLCTGYWRPSKIMSRFGGGKKGKNHLRLIKDDDEDPPRYLH